MGWKERQIILGPLVGKAPYLSSAKKVVPLGLENLETGRGVKHVRKAVADRNMALDPKNTLRPAS
jgi:hypothetical protein